MIGTTSTISARQAPVARAGDAPVRVLLVEDDPGDAFLVEELLGEAADALELRWVRTAAEAVTAVTATTECVLLDLGLPDTEGLDGLQRMIEAAPRAAVIVLTGLADEHRGLEAVAAGAQDYLAKGQVDGELLARSIRYAIERKRGEENQRRLVETELLAEENARLERGLLPMPLVNDPELSVVTRYRPGRHQAQLGGDFYDAVETDDGTLHLVIGDVCGHGPDEAALGVYLRIAWRTLVLAGQPSAEILKTLEQVLVRERRGEEIFATVCVVTIPRDRTGGCVYLAGHPSPVLLRPGGGPAASLLGEPSGPAIGMVPGASWPGVKVELGDQWSLLLYTDGLVEGRLAGGHERLGERAMLGLVDVAYRAGVRGQQLLDDVIGAVVSATGGEQADDTAAVLCTRGHA